MFYIIVFSIIIIVLLFIFTYNKIKTLKVKITEAKSDLEIYLIKRYDILTESVKVAKKYMEHEKDLMLEITKIRKGISIDEAKKIIIEQETYFDKFLATAEAYPQLYSSDLFRTLQLQISETNDHLSASKRLYNSNISNFNQFIVMFPINIIAKILKEKEQEFLKDEKIEEKTNFKLDL